MALTIILVLLLGIGTGGIGYLIWQNAEMNRAAEEIAKTPIPEILDVQDEGVSGNPIDFAELQAENPDIYAWIYIPGTEVNLPILQHPHDDGFYLSHNRHGLYAAEGSIYTELQNNRDFKDPVTLIYGHNMKNGSMFASLHEFEDPAFFAANRTMYIYTPDEILTYRVAAAYQYDNRHILNSFDFSDPAVVQDYFRSVSTPSSSISNVEEGLSLDSRSDKIVQLSTCTGDENRLIRRYIVTGELVNEQETINS